MIRRHDPDAHKYRVQEPLDGAIWAAGIIWFAYDTAARSRGRGNQRATPKSH